MASALNYEASLTHPVDHRLAEAPRAEAPPVLDSSSSGFSHGVCVAAYTLFWLAYATEVSNSADSCGYFRISLCLIRSPA